MNILRIGWDKSQSEYFTEENTEPEDETEEGHEGPTPPGGAASLGARVAMVWATPGPPLTLSLSTFFSLPRKHQFIAQNRVLAVLAHNFSISLLSPSLLLKFGAFVLRYVTPPLVQVDLCLVDYILSILLL